MFVTNNDFKIIENALITTKESDIKMALKIIQDLKEKKEKDNKRKYAFISEKRKTDKTYANKRKKV